MILKRFLYTHSRTLMPLAHLLKSEIEQKIQDTNGIGTFSRKQIQWKVISSLQQQQQQQPKYYF